MPLIEFTDRGLYCERGDFYIDPWKPVSKALITHGHSDHSRWGHKQYIATKSSVPIIRHRLGDISIVGLDYGDTMLVNGIKVSFYPAGHIIGSAQIRVEHKGEIWVISGDYKPGNDQLSGKFEVQQCHHFVTESTFGLPVFNWRPQEEIFAEIKLWWQQNQQAGQTSILCAYSLGKAQRLIQGLGNDIPGTIFTHGAVENMNEVLRSHGTALLPTTRISRETPKEAFQGQLIIAPPSAVGSSWIKRFKHPVIGMASGWMALRGARRRRAADRGFVLSDHADWKGLNEVIEATGAENIYVTHGYTDIFTQWLREKGYNAHIVSTEYGNEVEEKIDAEIDLKEAS